MNTALYDTLQGSAEFVYRTVSWPLFSNFLHLFGPIWVPWSPKDTIWLWWPSNDQQIRFEKRLVSKTSPKDNQNRWKKVGILKRPSTIYLLDARTVKKGGYMKVHLSYPIKDMSYASIADDRAWAFESTGPTVGWSNW